MLLKKIGLYIPYDQHLLLLVPRPSAWTKCFFFVLNVHDKIFCPWLKTHYMAFYLVKLFCKRVDTLLSNKKNHFEWASKAKLDFLPMDQIFCPGKFQICPGQKKRFVLAYGRGIKMFITFILSNLTKLNSSFGKVFLDWFLTDCPQLFLWPKLF